MVRITGFAFCTGAGFAVGVHGAGGAGVSTAKGLMVLNMVGWLSIAAGLPTAGKGATTACLDFTAGLELGLGLTDGVLFVVLVLASAGVVAVEVEVG